MYVRILLFFCFIVHFQLFGQQFNKTIEPANIPNHFGSWGRGIFEVDTNYLIVATGYYGVPLLTGKQYNCIINSNGDTAYSFTYQPSNDTSSLIIMPEGTLKLNDSVFVTSRTECYVPAPNNNYCHVNIIWYKANGDTIFSRNFTSNTWIDGPTLYKYDQDIYLCGSIYTNAQIGQEIFVAKIGFDGIIKWEKSFGDSGVEEWGYSICKASNRGVVVGVWSDLVGLNGPNITQGYTSLYRLDSNGNKLWKKKLWPNKKSYFSIIRQCTDSNYFVSSLADTIIDLDDAVVNGVIAKIDTAGNFIWQKFFNDIPQATKQIWSYIVLDNDDILVVGSIIFGGFSEDYGWLCRLDSSGHIKWEHLYQSFAGSTFGILDNAIQMPDGGFMLTGSARDSITNYQSIWLLRTDSMGCLVPGCVPTSTTQYEMEDFTSKLKIYPNPSQGIFTITIPEIRSEATIEITDMSGKKLFAAVIDQNENNKSVNLKLSPGLYFVHCYYGNESYVKKFIIQ